MVIVFASNEMIPSFLNSEIVRMVFSVVIEINSPISRLVIGILKVSFRYIFLARNNKICATLPFICFWFRSKRFSIISSEILLMRFKIFKAKSLFSRMTVNNADNSTSHTNVSSSAAIEYL